MNLSSCACSFIWSGACHMMYEPKSDGGLSLCDLATLNFTTLLGFGWETFAIFFFVGSFTCHRFSVAFYKK